VRRSTLGRSAHPPSRFPYVSSPAPARSPVTAGLCVHLCEHEGGQRGGEGRGGPRGEPAERRGVGKVVDRHRALRGSRRTSASNSGTQTSASKRGVRVQAARGRDARGRQRERASASLPDVQRGARRGGRGGAGGTAADNGYPTRTPRGCASGEAGAASSVAAVDAAQLSISISMAPLARRRRRGARQHARWPAAARCGRLGCTCAP